jgi:protein-tyrosine phosphatase
MQSSPDTPVLPTRSLRFAGAPNFRDLGGYQGLEGRTVRWRRRFRSDHLGALTPQDLATLTAEVGPALRVCDFRGVSERETAACCVPGAAVHSLPIEPTVVQRLTDLIAAGHALTPADTVGLMQITYRDFVRENTPRFAALFAHLLQAHDAPLVFHCTAGKDRTGFAAALILLSLGVPQDDVMHDYLLTNTHLPVAPAARGGLPEAVVGVLYRVQEEFLAAAFDAVREGYGGMDAYLAKGLGLGPAERRQLARQYLQD